MEEFKTAHSKMFNRLRKANGNNEGRKITNDQKRDDDERQMTLAEPASELSDHSPETKSPPATNKISNGNANLDVNRPRPTVATN